MFEQLKQIKQIKKLHNALQEEKVEIEKQGIKIAVSYTHLTLPTKA